MDARGKSLIFAALCVGITVPGLYNVLSDNADVVSQAKEVACGEQGKSCKSALTRADRSAFSQLFTIDTRKRKVDVRCKRAFVLVGSYACAIE